MLQELLWWQSCWCWLCPYRLEMVWKLMVARVVWPWDKGVFAICFRMSIYSVRFATLISSFNYSILVLCAYWKRFDYARAMNEDRTTNPFLRLNTEKAPEDTSASLRGIVEEELTFQCDSVMGDNIIILVSLPSVVRFGQDLPTFLLPPMAWIPQPQSQSYTTSIQYIPLSQQITRNKNARLCHSGYN